MELSQNPSRRSPRVQRNLNSDIENIENLTLDRFYTYSKQKEDIKNSLVNEIGIN